MEKGAILSIDKRYRYQLWRIWDEYEPKIGIVGLNPSTADENVDDPTIIRCIEFAKSWGYGGLYMVNLFAYRATDPNELLSANSPVGSENDIHLQDVFSKVDKVVCAWGNGGGLLGRNFEVLNLIKTPFCLQINKSGEPSHPLYLKNSLTPIPFSNSNNIIQPIKSEKMEANSKATNEKESQKPKHVLIRSNVEKTSIYQHRQKHFEATEDLLEVITINDRAFIFNQEDNIIIGSKTIYWYMGRVGEFYTKSNDEIDAKHESDELILKLSDIEAWKAVTINDQCFLELQQKDGRIHRSAGLKMTEINSINELQIQLNKLSASEI